MRLYTTTLVILLAGSVLPSFATRGGEDPRVTLVARGKQPRASVPFLSPNLLQYPRLRSTQVRSRPPPPHEREGLCKTARQQRLPAPSSEEEWPL
jgi:hypothetical protein